MDWRWIGYILYASSLLPTVIRAQEVQPIDLQAVRQRQPAFLVRADVDRPSRQYRAGDQLTLKVVSEKDAFVYVLYQQADGQVFQVFPNSRQPNNRLPARQTVQIPDLDDLFRWRIGPPFGKETVKVIAALEPIKGLDLPQLRAGRFNAVSATQWKGVALELDANPDQPTTDPNLPEPVRRVPVPTPDEVVWAEADVEIETSQEDPGREAGRRVGVFFGVSDHKFAQFAELETGSSPNLSSPQADAEQLAALMRDIGRLHDSRTFTNATATRQNLEHSICSWLPGVTRPGDTVVIYFSGHGGQIDDDNQDEADGLDEFLVPHDYLGTAAAVGLLKLAAADKLPAEYVPLAKAIQKLIDQCGPEVVTQALVRQTGVTDDLFGHWLQRLDGRKVVVILDICHSGGFATAEKNLQANGKQPAFDFLDRELTRLKDIGQTNTALLTASSTAEVSLVRLDGKLSVMTYYLLDSLAGHAGPLDLQTAYKECDAGMQTYFRDHPQTRPHHPQLYHGMGQRLYLKP